MIELLIPALIMGVWGAAAGMKERTSGSALNPKLFSGQKYLVNPPSGYNENPTVPIGYSDNFDYSNEGGSNIDIQGDAGFVRTVEGYINTLSKSEEGRQVLSEVGNVSVVPANGVASYGYGNTIELNATFPFGYGMFTHELRHCWQDATGFEGGGLAREHDANKWQAARCMESGSIFGALAGAFMAFDPITAAVNSAYYGKEA